MNKELIENIRKAGIAGITDANCANLSIESAEEIISLCHQAFKDKKSEAELNIGKWLLIALDDEGACAEMKVDIVKWFTFIETEK